MSGRPGFFLTGLTALGLSMGCTDSGKGADTRPHGAAQKGPFAIGSSVSVESLDGSFSSTGKIFTAQTSNDRGEFAIDADTGSRVRVVVDGFYFDEVQGVPSGAPLTLRATASLQSGDEVNVNVLTDLQRRRLEGLIEGGSSFAEAAVQARAETLAAFGIVSPAIAPFDQLDIAEAGADNAILLAVSAILQQIAVSRSASSGSVVAELSAALAEIGTDLADGDLDDAGDEAAIRAASDALDLAAVRENLEARYAALGGAVIPAFEDWIDSDGDGTLNRDDFSLDFPTVENHELGVTITSDALPVNLPAGGTETATVTAGTLLVNGSDTGNSTAQVAHGDLVAIRLGAAAAFAYPETVASVVSTITVGGNTGSFTIETRTYTVHVELSWDTATVDVDLHLLRAGGMLYSTSGDCYYGAANPDWGVPGPIDNPGLDINDVDGFGPENINVNTPYSAETFRVFVHFYSDDGIGSTNALLRIYLAGGEVFFEASGLLQQTGVLWEVATIEMPAGTITFVDTFGTL